MELQNKPDLTPQPTNHRDNNISGYLINIAISIIFLYILNNLLDLYVPWIPGDFSKFFWNILNNVYNHVEIPHLSKAFVQCLWAINTFLGTSIIGNFFLLLYRPRWLHHLIQAFIAGVAILALFVVYNIYPFNFDSSNINLIIHTVLIIIMVGLGIGMVGELVRFIMALLRQCRLNHAPPPISNQFQGPMPDQISKSD